MNYEEDSQAALITIFVYLFLLNFCSYFIFSKFEYLTSFVKLFLVL